METCSDFSDNPHALSLKKGMPAFERWVQCFAIWMLDEYRGDDAVRFYERNLEYFKSQLEKNRDKILQVKNPDDLKGDDTRLRAILTVEGGSALAGRPERVEKLKNDGVKMITLTWNAANEIGSGQLEDRGGLTKIGKEIVKEMDCQGVIVDVSHLNDDGFYDVASIAGKPFVASHSNLRSIQNHKRNLTDEQFRIIRDVGGIVGLNFYTGFISDENPEDFEALFRHVYHFLELGGENTLCMGSDFDGADVPKYIKDISCVPALYNKMAQYGLDKTTLDKIFYENSVNFFEKNLT